MARYDFEYQDAGYDTAYRGMGSGYDRFLRGGTVRGYDRTFRDDLRGDYELWYRGRRERPVRPALGRSWREIRSGDPFRDRARGTPFWLRRAAFGYGSEYLGRPLHEEDRFPGSTRRFSRVPADYRRYLSRREYGLPDEERFYPRGQGRLGHRNALFGGAGFRRYDREYRRWS